MLSIPDVDPDITSIVRITKEISKAKNWLVLIGNIHDGQKSDNSTDEYSNKQCIFNCLFIDKIKSGCVELSIYVYIHIYNYI